MNKKWVTIVSRVVIGLLVLTMLAGMILPMLACAGAFLAVIHFL